jgi:hypothetical protein
MVVGGTPERKKGLLAISAGPWLLELVSAHGARRFTEF